MCIIFGKGRQYINKPELRTSQAAAGMASAGQLPGSGDGYSDEPERKKGSQTIEIKL